MSSSEMHRNSTSSTKSNAVQKALKAASRRLQEHHQAVNAAYGAYYGTPFSSAPATRRPSAESTSSVESVSKPNAAAPSTLSKAWQKVKQHNKEVNAAYAAYYCPRQNY